MQSTTQCASMLPARRPTWRRFYDETPPPPPPPLPPPPLPLPLRLLPPPAWCRARTIWTSTGTSSTSSTGLSTARCVPYPTIRRVTWQRTFTSVPNSPPLCASSPGTFSTATRDGGEVEEEEDDEVEAKVVEKGTRWVSKSRSKRLGAHRSLQARLLIVHVTKRAI